MKFAPKITRIRSGHESSQTTSPHATVTAAKKGARKGPTSDETKKTRPRKSLDGSPLVKFFKALESEDYTYTYGPAHKEFQKLADVKHQAWLKTKHRDKKYWKEPEHRNLKKRFEEAVEEQFNFFVGKRGKEKGIADWEYVVMMLKLGTPPMSTQEAKLVRVVPLDCLSPDPRGGEPTKLAALLILDFTERLDS